MRKVFQFVVLAIILFSFYNCEKNTNRFYYDSTYKKEIAKVREEASLFMIMNNIPGASFAIAKKGKLIYSEAMGIASKDLEVQASRKTKFRIGATTEIFTSLIYQMMVEEGKIHPDSSIQFYLPDYPMPDFNDTARLITIEHLVNHTSGIREPSFTEKSWRGLNVNMEQSLDDFKNDHLDFIPGAYNSPSEFNYRILGVIMEKISGRNYSQLLKSYITDSLQLSNTEVDNPFRTIIGRTDFYDLNLVAQVVNATFIDMRPRSSSEGILSNAEDLVKFGNTLLYSDKISTDIKDRIFTPMETSGENPASIANGWIVQQSKYGDPYYGKLGSVKGGGSIILILPKEELVLAGTVNLTSDNEIPIFRLLQAFLPDQTESREKQE